MFLYDAPAITEKWREINEFNEIFYNYTPQFLDDFSGNSRGYN